jgi:hypothetical protein
MKDYEKITALLSREERRKIEQDLLLYGNAFIHLTADAVTGECGAQRVEPENILISEPRPYGKHK